MNFKEIFDSNLIEKTYIKENKPNISIPFECKTALTRARGYISFNNQIQFTLNPYYGCTFGCLYCYVAKSFSFIHRNVGNRLWGKWVLPKINIPKILSKEIQKIEKKGNLKNLSIRFSSISDSYQKLEEKYHLTEQCLKVFIKFRPKYIYLQTKSDLILRDIDILEKLKKNLILSFTITTDEDRIAKIFEPNAPLISKRIKVIEKFFSMGFNTEVLIAPILPQNPAELSSQLNKITNRVVIKSYLDDGRNGRNLRIPAKMELIKNKWDYIMNPEYGDFIYETFKSKMGSNRVGRGKKDFINTGFYDELYAD